MGARPNSLIVVEQVYFQGAGGQPTSTESRFSRQLQTDEQPWHCQMTLTEKWVPLDCGWVVEAGMLVVKNEAGRGLQVYPDEEEKRAIVVSIVEVTAAAQVIEADMGLDYHAQWLVLPGESLRAQPADLRSIRLRCAAGTCRVSITIVPR